MKFILTTCLVVACVAEASAQIAVSSNDNKAVLVNGVNTVPPNLVRVRRL